MPGGGQEPNTLKGTQSDPNYVSRLLARSECLPGGGLKNYTYATGSFLRAEEGSVSRTLDTATLKQRLCDVQSAGGDDVG